MCSSLDAILFVVTGPPDCNRSAPAVYATRPLYRRYEPLHPGLEDSDKFRVHKLIVIRNIETDDPFAVEVGAESGSESTTMNLLHHEDRVGPLQEIGCQRVFGISVKPCRSDLDPGMGREDMFCRRATEPISTTDEKKSSHRRKGVVANQRTDANV